MLKKSIVGCLILAIFCTIFVSCSNGANQDPDQIFVTQTSDANDLRCGAFSLAFYKWLKEGKTYSSDQTTDYSTVDSIYTNVKFGSAYSNVGGMDLSASSNPLKMLHYAIDTLGESSAEFYRDSTIPEMEGIHTAISTNDSSLLTTYTAKDKTGGIPTLNNGDYAIVVCAVYFANGIGPISLHWILFHKTLTGYIFYDPYFGMAKSATENQLRGIEQISVTYPEFGERRLQSMNSCLFLPL
jgi:hypothetical protein